MKKTRYGKQMLISFLIAAVGLILLLIFLISEAIATDAKIPLCSVAACIFLVGFIWLKIVLDKSVKVCDQCGESMYGCAYEYQEARREYSDTPNVNSYKLTAHIEATCPHCGAIKSFDKTFTIYPNNNPDYVVGSYCKRHFRR